MKNINIKKIFPLCAVSCLFLNMPLVSARLDFALSPAGMSEWTQHAHDAQKTGFQPQSVEMPWKWKWSWNGPDASGAAATDHHEIPRNVQPVTGGGYVFIADGSAGVRVLSQTDGSVVRTISPGGDINATPAYDPDGGYLYIVSTDGALYKANPETGAIAGNFSAGPPIEFAPCLAGGRIFICAGTTVTAVDKSAMSMLWSYDAGSTVETPPAYSSSRNSVIVVAQDLYVHCIGNANGVQVWKKKPTSRTYQTGRIIGNDRAEALWGWPVIAEKHGLVLVKYRLDWNTLYGAWSPWPADNAAIRSNLESRPDQQCMFALSLDDGSSPFICNTGHGGWGDGDFMPMGPMPCVRSLGDASEVAYAVVRGHVMYDGRWDSHAGEMMLDGATIPGFDAGHIRYIRNAYANSSDNEQFFLTDEQPFISIAGDYVFTSHWENAMASVKISDRGPARGSWDSKIQTVQGPNMVTSQDGSACAFSSGHFCPNGLQNTRDYSSGFYIYHGQGSFYDNYWTGYACVVVSNGLVLVRSCDGAIVCLESGSPQGLSRRPSTGTEARQSAQSNPSTFYSAPPGMRSPDGPQRMHPLIAFSDAHRYAGTVVTAEGTLKCVFNNGKAVYLGFTQPHHGSLVVRIMRSDWGNFSRQPEKMFHKGQTIRVTGKIGWYQGDPVIYAHRPSQIHVVSPR